MEIYDAITQKIVKSPDLTTGYLVDGTIIIGYTPEVVRETITNSRPNGLTERVPIVEQCQWYHKYPTIADAVSEKLVELSSACNSAIMAGADVQLSDGSTSRFSYSIEDQSNISNMFNAVVMGASQFPYHSDGETCKVYSAQDIITIYATLSAFTTAQTTYHNMLKQYVESLKTVPEIQEVTYGQELTGEYLEKYNEMLSVANEQMQNVLSKAAQYTV